MPGQAIDALLRERVHAQRLADATRIRGEAADVARAICGAQAQDLAAGMLSLRARSTALTAASAAHAHGPGRTLVRTWLMRGTLHLVAADDARWLLAVYGPLNAARDATRRRQTGLDDDLCDRAIRVIRTALAGGPLTRQQLREKLEAAAAKVPAGQAMIHLLGLAASRGVLTLTQQIGRRNTFTLLEDVVPAQSRTLKGDRADAELARRYFTAYAPAAVADFAYWSGLPMSRTRRAVAAIAGELEDVPAALPGQLRLRAAARHDTSDAPPTVRLLPYFDTYLLGYRHRDLMIAPDRAPRIYNGGWINPTVCIDGRLEGTWRLRPARGAADVEVVPWSPLPRGVRSRVDEEVTALGSFLATTARLVWH